MKKLRLLAWCLLIVTVAAFVFVGGFLSIEQVNYRDKENKIESLQVEINNSGSSVSKEQVENVLGQGKVDVSSGGGNEKVLIINKCGSVYEQYYYRGNTSVLSGRWEDRVVVYFSKNGVCHFKRYGLGPNWTWFR
jgi:hypothetical protein